jgi:hypothetical protein
METTDLKTPPAADSRVNLRAFIRTILVGGGLDGPHRGLPKREIAPAKPALGVA